MAKCGIFNPAHAMPWSIANIKYTETPFGHIQIQYNAGRVQRRYSKVRGSSSPVAGMNRAPAARRYREQQQASQCPLESRMNCHSPPRAYHEYEL